MGFRQGIAAATESHGDIEMMRKVIILGSSRITTSVVTRMTGTRDWTIMAVEMEECAGSIHVQGQGHHEVASKMAEAVGKQGHVQGSEYQRKITGRRSAVEWIECVVSNNKTVQGSRPVLVASQ